MAVIHFINRPKSQTKAGLIFVLCYTMQDKKTVQDGRKYVNGINCTPLSAYTEFQNTKLLHGKDTGRQYYHFVQSFPSGEAVTPDIAHEVALKFVEQSEKFQGFEVVISTHADRNHIHSHFVMNSVNAETGRKFHINTNEIEELMALSDSIIEPYGLSICVPDRNREVKQSLSNSEYYAMTNRSSWKLELALTIDSCMKLAKSKRHFLWLMGQEGYGVKWTDTRKYITYTTPDGNRCRDNKLHEEKYSKENMEYEFRIRADFLRGIQESGNSLDKISGTGRADRYRDRAELEGADCPDRSAEPMAGIPVGADRTASYKTGNPKNAEHHADESHSRVSETTDRYADYFRINQSGEREYVNTGWENERSELFFSGQSENSDDRFYEKAVRDFTGSESELLIDTLYLAADLQNLIDDDGEIVDCTTRYYGPEHKRKQGYSSPVMGGM